MQSIDDYQELAMRTAKIMEMHEMLNHGALGILTEVGELAEPIIAMAEQGPEMETAQADMLAASFTEELGDGMWFAAYLANALGLQLSFVLDTYRHAQERASPGILTLKYAAAAAAVGSRIKSFCFYSKPLDNEKLAEELSWFVFYNACLVQELGLNGPDVLRANIAKLSKRYPEKYTDQAAIERADKVEDRVPYQESDTAPVSISDVHPLSDEANEISRSNQGVKVSDDRSA